MIENGNTVRIAVALGNANALLLRTELSQERWTHISLQLGRRDANQTREITALLQGIHEPSSLRGVRSIFFHLSEEVLRLGFQDAPDFGRPLHDT